MKRTVTAVLFILAISIFAGQAMAEMYKWVDKNGVTHFSDTPPKSEQKVEVMETTTYVPPSLDSEKKRSKKGSDAYRKRKTSNQVEIYTTSWCRYCKDAIKFLRSNGVRFTQYDIEKDRKAASRMKTLGGSGGVPFAIINGKQFRGFSKKRYKRALGIQ